MPHYTNAVFVVGELRKVGLFCARTPHPQKDSSERAFRKSASNIRNVFGGQEEIRLVDSAYIHSRN